MVPLGFRSSVASLLRATTASRVIALRRSAAPSPCLCSWVQAGRAAAPRGRSASPYSTSAPHDEEISRWAEEPRPPTEGELLLQVEAAEDAALREVLRREMGPRWEEPAAVWRDEETGRIRWIAADEAKGVSGLEDADHPAKGSDGAWFVDTEYPAVGNARMGAGVEAGAFSMSSYEPRPAPRHLPEHLVPLHEHLSRSPFLDPGTLEYIDAKGEEGGMGEAAWVDWVVVASLRPGRERGIAGAVDGIKQTLKGMQLSASEVRTEGLHNPHAVWCLIDADSVVVHVLTAEAREVYDVEGVWTGKRRPDGSERQGGPGAQSGRRLNIW